MKQHSILILAEEPFARELVTRWQSERVVPAFTIRADLAAVANGSLAGDVAVIDAASIEAERLHKMLGFLQAAGVQALCVAPELSRLEPLRSAASRFIPVRQAEGWKDIVVSVATEVLRRIDAQNRARRAESVIQRQTGEAALGRYMLDTRHGFNNALTAVLGNAELLLLDRQGLPPQVREQLTIIHSMALRLHEMMQRFSSLETEMLTGEDTVPAGKSKQMAASS